MRDKKEGEILVEERYKKTISEKGANVAFFEKEFIIGDEKKIKIREYIYIFFGNDKYSKLIRPVTEKKYIDKNKNAQFLKDSKFYPVAYKYFTDLKESLNLKEKKKSNK